MMDGLDGVCVCTKKNKKVFFKKGNFLEKIKMQTIFLASLYFSNTFVCTIFSFIHSLTFTCTIYLYLLIYLLQKTLTLAQIELARAQTAESNARRRLVESELFEASSSDSGDRQRRRTREQLTNGRTAGTGTGGTKTSYM